MIILGIDPGTAIVGYGVIEFLGNRYRLIDYGTITTPAHTPLPDRLQKIYRGINFLVREFKPDAAAVEELFFNRNTTTALSVGQARGVILLALKEFEVPISSYTPLQVKQAISGYGRADKKQVQFMIKTILNMPDIPKPDDAADGLALAVCHSHWQKGQDWQAANLNAKQVKDKETK